MTIRLHRGDLPDLSHYRTSAVAIDTETMGLQPHRDRLSVVQLSPGDGSADVVQMPAGGHTAPNLANILSDPAILKVFHFGRFDLGARLIDRSGCANCSSTAIRPSIPSLRR